MFEGNSLWHLIAQTDAITKFVLLILLVMSVICWAVFLCKTALAYVKQRDMKQVLRQMRTAKNIDDMLAIAAKNSQTLPGYFLSHNLRFVKTILQDGQEKLAFDTSDMERVHYHLDQSVDMLVGQEEQYLPILTTTAGVAPLLGLFGTIWGLIHAFMGIAQSQVADISTVAPGIAEALITTLAGLVVAIPALIMVNYLVVQVRVVEQQLVQLSDRVAVMVQSILIKKRNICVDLSVAAGRELQQ